MISSGWEFLWIIGTAVSIAAVFGVIHLVYIISGAHRVSQLANNFSLTGAEVIRRARLMEKKEIR